DHRRGGFTLTEMLVVLGIILILMSVLLPAVMAAKRASRKTACAARLHAIGEALTMYVSANDDIIPQACTSNSQDSPESRAGTTNLHFTSPGVQRGFVPPTDASAQYLGPPGFKLPLAPMPYFLGKDTLVNEQVWSCPAIRKGQSGQFRTYQ